MPIQPSTSILAAGLAGLLALAACTDHEPSMIRGDRLWAEEDYEGALAEYRLAASQSGGDVDALIRVAHGFARAGDLTRARDAYARVLSRAPDYADQAIFDYLGLARRALERRDRYGMAVAVDAALEMRPGLDLGELAAPLAAFYAENGDTDRALVFYEKALATAPAESAPAIMFELGRLRESQGRCEEALALLEAYLRHQPRGSLAGDARWHRGRCAFDLARASRAEGRLTRSLELLGIVIAMRVPENLQDQAWFERGEILYAMDREDEALIAYRQVLELNPARTGQLVERALQRIDDIRFRY